MDIVIAGAGEVGRHVAAVLAADNHEITLIDRLASKLESVADNLDVRTLVGPAARSETLLEAGVDRAGLFVAATDSDERNLLSASVAKGLGCKRAIARVLHSAYHASPNIDYAAHFGIDQIVCPEYLTSLAIAGVLRDPAIHAVEHFARGQIVMERVEVSDQASVLGKPLRVLGLPPGLRIGIVIKHGRAIVPTAETVIESGNEVTLVGTTEVLEKILPEFRRGKMRPRRIVVMGGSAISVWLARALNKRSFKIRLFVQDHDRAEELAEKLPHATVIQADPADAETFADENLAEADAFVAAAANDEYNILGALQAKHLGGSRTVAVINQTSHHQLIERLGIDQVFSPSMVAAREIQRLAQRETVRQITRLDEHGTAVYEIHVGSSAPVVGKTVLQIELPKGCVLIAVQQGDEVRVPGPRDVIAAGDTVIAIAQDTLRRKLNALFA